VPSELDKLNITLKSLDRSLHGLTRVLEALNNNLVEFHRQWKQSQEHSHLPPGRPTPSSTPPENANDVYIWIEPK